MTQEQTAIMNDFFTRYGHPSKDQEILLTGYFVRPDTITDTKQIEQFDHCASQLLSEIQEAQKCLQAYRFALAEQYNRLETAPKIPCVRLRRRKDSYSNKVFYYLDTYLLNLDNGAETDTKTKTYPGSDRWQAIKDYQQYLKDHPGIKAEMHIGKSRWER